LDPQVRTDASCGNDSSTIASNRIRCISEDKQGYIWIGTAAED